MAICDVAIIGAGPYGLSTSAHLRTIRGLQVRVFGEPMSFWDRTMPKGMLLRSNWTATQIADPRGSLTLEAFREFSGNHLSTPVPLDRFIEYGLWYQRQAVPDLERVDVAKLETDPKGFRLTLANGEPVYAKRVIVAVGIGSFARRPEEFEGLPPSLVSHTSEHCCLQQFSNKKVLVVGSGQSALESGALLHETGADVEIVGRADHVNWLQGRLSRMLHHELGKLIRRLLYAPTDVGPAGISQLMARPDLLRRLPRDLQDRLRKRAVRPAGARWLVARLDGVPIKLGRSVKSVVPLGRQVRVSLSDGSERTVDHILLGTGYKVDISKYKFLAPELLAGIRRVNGFPILGKGLESSVPRLHILGAPAAWSFGPLMQFVSGTNYASPAVWRAVSASA